jgi:hypothetical protein
MLEANRSPGPCEGNVTLPRRFGSCTSSGIPTFRTTATRRPWGIDQFDLVIAVRHGQSEGPEEEVLPPEAHPREEEEAPERGRADEQEHDPGELSREVRRSTSATGRLVVEHPLAEVLCVQSPLLDVDGRI